MARSVRPPGATVREGLGALAKCALLLVGVPATLARLWLLAAPAGRPIGAPESLAVHAVLAAVGAGWLVAGGSLARDLVGALAKKPLDPTTWSRRWAVRLAALVVMIAAGAAAVGTGRARSAATVPRVPAAAARPSPAAALRLEALVVEAACAAFGALLGAAIGRRARLLARAAATLRRPGERLPRRSPSLVRLETLLGELADGPLLDWVDGANRLLWRSLRDAGAGRPAPEVTIVRAGPDGIELLLEQPSPDALEGFVALEDGRWWCLDPDLDLDELGRRTAGCGRLLPALVPLGEDGTASYLLNVSPRRRLAVAGDPVRARRALSAMLLSLRCLPWADELAVELVALDPPAAAERCYQVSASSPEELAAVASGPDHDPAARLDDRWSRQPLVVTALAPTLEHEALLGRCRGRAGVVSLGGHGDVELELDGDGAWLEPLGLRLAPPCPSPDDLAGADRLLAEAGSSPRPAAPSPRPAAGCEPAPAPPAGSGRIELVLLDGPARLDGMPPGTVAPRDAPRVVEVVAYLSLNGGVASAQGLAEALFAGHAGSGAAERLERLLAATRAGLGLAGDGTAMLQRPSAGEVALHREAGWDGARLIAAATAARDTAPEEAEALLRAGLGLVGPACQRPGYAWLGAQGGWEDLLATVVDAAHHLALLALARGDAGAARWAVERGRRAEPCSEILARDLMLACDLDGDRTGAAAAWAALEEGLADLGGNEPSEASRNLHAALSGDDAR